MVYELATSLITAESLLRLDQRKAEQQDYELAHILLDGRNHYSAYDDSLYLVQLCAPDVLLDIQLERLNRDAEEYSDFEFHNSRDFEQEHMLICRELAAGC